MLSRLAVARLYSIIILSMLIAASSAAVYYHYDVIEPQLASLSGNKFALANLIIDPAIAEPRQPVNISVEVTNIIGNNGTYKMDLTINGSLRDTQNVQVAGFATAVANFTVNETALGVYSAAIGNLSGTFSIQRLEIPDTLKLSNLAISPYEAWANETVTISVDMSNTGAENITYLLPVTVNNVVKNSQIMQLSGGATETAEFNVTESSEGTYAVLVGGLKNQFVIVPTGKHTLNVFAFGAVPFTINGASAITPYIALLDAGTYAITMPESYETRTAGNFYRHWQWEHWGDGDASLTKTIDLKDYTSLTAAYNVTQSCPSLYVWNGVNYVFMGDVSSSGGWLGFVDHYKSDGSIVFAYSHSLDYMKLGSQTQSRNGYFDLAVVEQTDEIYYFDSAELIAVDHPANVDVFSTAKTYMYQLDSLGKIYTVSKNPSPPVSAITGEGQDVMPQILRADGITTKGNLWKWDSLQLNLGNLTGAKEIKLIVTGISVWRAGSGSTWNSQYTNQPGVTPQPPPYMEVKDASGNWVRVPDNREFPILPATPQTIVVDLTGLFPTRDYSLRINSFQDFRFDWIAVDTTPEQNVTLWNIKPSYADLTQKVSASSDSSGNFTRFGDALPLLLSVDDKMVIGRIGDQVSLRFPDDLGPVPAGIVRDYFFVANLWFKGKWVANQPFTTDPLPFQKMSSYPYPPNESYPYDADHLSYLKEYNTRSIQSSISEANLNSLNTLGLFGGVASVFTYFSSQLLYSRISRRRKQTGFAP